MSADGETPRSTRRPWLRYGLYGLAGMGAAGVVVLSAVYLVLRSPAAMSRLLPLVSSALDSSAGVRVRAGRASIDLLSGAEFRDLEVRWKDPARGTARLDIDHLTLAFEPWQLLRGRLFLDRLRVAGMELHGDLKLPAATSQGPRKPPPDAGGRETPAPAGESDWRDLARALAAPPLALRARNLAITDGHLDLRVARPGRTLRYRSSLDVHADARWQPDHLHARTRLVLGGRDPGRLTLEGGSEARGLTARARPVLRLDLDWSMERQGSGWRFRLDPLEQRVRITGVRVSGPVRAE
ncbi:MAG TPA: hypothetical protein VKA48_04265, partial [Gammaproteobacteria bacterium]|nr:hypothetical protein [Gammaproteobacteria bacterium]